MHIFKKLSALALSLLLLLQIEGSYLLPISAATVKAVSPTVSVGNQFMIALNSKGIAYAWGDNTSGTLGDGTTSSRSYAAAVTMPDHTLFTAISAGSDHVMAMTADGCVYTWRSNGNGQLGYTTQDSTQKTPRLVETLPHDQQIYAVAIAAGNNFSLALMSNGTVWSWGINTQRQLGVPTQSDDPEAGINARTTPVAIGGTVSGIFFTDIFAGDSSAAAIASDGKVFLWGSNESNMQGTTNDLKTAIQFSPPNLTAEKKLVFGSSHTVVLSDSG